MPDNRFMRLPEVCLSTGLSRATIYREIERNSFPRQLQLSRRCVGWWSNDIDAWKAARAAIPCDVRIHQRKDAPTLTPEVPQHPHN